MMIGFGNCLKRDSIVGPIPCYLFTIFLSFVVFPIGSTDTLKKYAL